MRRFIHSLLHPGHFVAASRSLAPLAEPRDGAPDRRPKHFSACQFTAARGLCLAAITGADVQYWPDAIGGGAPPRNNSATDEGRPRRPRPAVAPLPPRATSSGVPAAARSSSKPSEGERASKLSRARRSGPRFERLKAPPRACAFNPNRRLHPRLSLRPQARARGRPSIRRPQ